MEYFILSYTYNIITIIYNLKISKSYLKYEFLHYNRGNSTHNLRLGETQISTHYGNWISNYVRIYFRKTSINILRKITTHDPLKPQVFVGFYLNCMSIKCFLALEDRIM